MNIVSHFLKAAKQFPNAPAFVEKGKIITYGELQKEVFKNVAALKNMGLKNGDNIMLMIPFSTELYTKILAIFSLGANVVLVDQLRPKTKIKRTFQKANCKAIITLPKFAILKYFLFHKDLWKSIITVKTGVMEDRETAIKSESDSALITFTTGTTGDAKAADRTHGFLNIQLRTLIEEMELKQGDVHLTSFPVVLMCNLAVGACSLIPPKYEKGSQWVSIKKDKPPNIISASPAHFSKLSELLDCANLNKLIIGGANVLPHFAKELAQKMDPQKVTLVYGSTEAEPMAALGLEEYLKSINQTETTLLIGKVHPKIQLKINAKDSAKVKELKEGEIGEIIVAGPHVLAKYYKDEPSFKANKIVEENTIWHRTGDAGYLKNNKVYLLGRLKYTWQENGKYLAPLVMEKYLSINGYKEEGTWLHIGNKNVLFIQNSKNTQLIVGGFPHRIDQIIHVKKISKDKRHLSRIDYEALLKLK